MHNWLKLIYPKCTTGLSKHVSDETDKKELMEKLHEMEQKGLVNPESSQKKVPGKNTVIRFIFYY